MAGVICLLAASHATAQLKRDACPKRSEKGEKKLELLLVEEHVTGEGKVDMKRIKNKSIRPLTEKLDAAACTKLNELAASYRGPEHDLGYFAIEDYYVVTVSAAPQAKRGKSHSRPVLFFDKQFNLLLAYSS